MLTSTVQCLLTFSLMSCVNKKDKVIKRVAQKNKSKTDKNLSKKNFVKS